MTEQVLTWIITFFGLLGFWLSGRKVWWSWYINVVNQIAWLIFALLTGYYALIIGVVFYSIIFSRNAYLWTKDHFGEKVLNESSS